MTNSDPPTALTEVQITRNLRIPVRDGCYFSATLYKPAALDTPIPTLVVLTPYTADHLHERGQYFAARGLALICVDVRGRGDSDGKFYPFVHEAHDGYDVVEWVARQSFCNGQVAMYGGSYLGYVQWAAASQLPPHLVTITPNASPFPGVDLPMRKNIMLPYMRRWLLYVEGHASQGRAFADEALWSGIFQRHRKGGQSLRQLDKESGAPSRAWQEWLDHPKVDSYWDSLNPTAAEYGRLDFPILTITGAYDGDQPGALEHYRRHLRSASSEARQKHYLVIGPWDHEGCGMPQREFGGITVGPASLVDIRLLHYEWFRWTLANGPRPSFLQDLVAYYVIGADQWKYASTLEEVTSREEILYLTSEVNPTDVFHSGSLVRDVPARGRVDEYIYDPKDFSKDSLESTLKWESLSDQTMVHAAVGSYLIYHSSPFEQETEVSGFFRLSAWIAINQPDTDFRARVFEIGIDGKGVELASDFVRARHRHSLREEKLIETSAPLLYEFDRFTFVSRLIRKGSRLRLVIDSNQSIHQQKNYGGGGIVAEETAADGRLVTITLMHETAFPSALHVPIGKDADA